MCKQKISSDIMIYMTICFYIFCSNKVVQQRLKENDEALSAQQLESSELKQREKLLQKDMTDLKKRIRELSNSLTAKETELQNAHAKYHEQMQKEYCSGTDQAQIKLDTLHMSISFISIAIREFFVFSGKCRGSWSCRLRWRGS